MRMHQLIASLLLSQGFTNLPDIVCVGYAPNTVGDRHKQVRHRTSAAFANRACEGPMDQAFYVVRIIYPFIDACTAELPVPLLLRCMSLHTSVCRYLILARPSQCEFDTVSRHRLSSRRSPYITSGTYAFVRYMLDPAAKLRLHLSTRS
jgi:hypothetical protein